MSRHTNDIYRRWLAQNGSTNPVRRRLGGMGGMPPMANERRSNYPPGDPRALPAANDQSYSRPEKRDYVDNVEKN